MAEKLFQARIDIATIEDLGDSTWQLTSTIHDISGSFTAMDVEVGDKIMITGISEGGKTVYDRYAIYEIVGRDTLFLMAKIYYDENDTPKTYGGYPLTGAHVIGRAYGPTGMIMEMPSAHEIEDEFRKDQGMANMNIKEILSSLAPEVLPEDISFEFRDVEVGTLQEYELDMLATFDYVISTILLVVDNGTIATSITIDNDPVPGLDNVDIGTSINWGNPTGPDPLIVYQGSSVKLLLSDSGYTGTPTLIRGKVIFYRYTG